MQTLVSQSLERGLQFLAARQMPSGQFPVEKTLVQSDGRAETSPDISLFATAHIAYALGKLPHAPAREMLNRALQFFLDEMEGPGLWRHWGRDDANNQRFIPADVDDIASISYLLRQHGVGFPDNRAIVLANRNRAGLFYTWLILRLQPTLCGAWWRAVLSELNLPRLTLFWRYTEAARNDVDAVVNANVLLYLGERDETRPAIVWLREIMGQGREADCDKWYRDPFTFYYAVSRAFASGVKGLEFAGAAGLARIGESVGADGVIGENALHTALALNALCNFGLQPDFCAAAVKHLLRAQRADGGWDSFPFYYGGPKRLAHWGSAELTTGLCLEALQHYAAP